MARYTHDVVATLGEYTDKTTGEKKKRYTNVGKAFTDEDGRLSIKLDTIPVDPNWSGWLSLYPADRDKGGGQRSQAPEQQPQRFTQSRPAAQAPPSAGDGDEDSIPPF